MKNILLISFILLTSIPSFATILRVNNSAGSSAPYSDLITAHANAATDDTIYIEGSNSNYGGLTVTKRLVIIGPGYFLDENPNTPASLSAVVGTFILQRTTTGDPSSGAAETQIIGLDFTQLSNTQIRVEVDDVIISKCRISTSVFIAFNNVSGVQIWQNYFNGSGLTSLSNNTGLNSFTFANNIINGNFSIVDNSTGGIFHNLFLAPNFIVESFNGEIRSNIAVSTSTTNFRVNTVGVSQISHNTAGNGQFGTTDNNNVASPTSLFVGPGNNSTDGQYQLLPTATQVINNAHDGFDRGPFGGNTPYSLSGLGDIPAIIYLELPPAGFPSATFNVTVRAVSGN